MTAPTQATAREAVEAIKQALAAHPTAGDWELCYLDTPLPEVGAYVQKCVEASGGDKYHFIRAVREDGVAVDIAHYGNGPTSNVNGHWACVTRPDIIRAIFADFAALLAAKQEELDKMREIAKDALDFMENIDPDGSFNPPTAEWAKSLTANLSNALKGGLPDVANVDAGRYRWLRGWGVAVERGGHIYTGDALDILVDGNMRLDAALSPSQQGEPK